ncbi:TPA: topoisomerase, partial [Listeria monocytogenes]|nr:topoisomerase [Listeria monocytogenes]
MKTVILAEKPSQAKEYASAMEMHSIKKGYI